MQTTRSLHELIADCLDRGDAELWEELIQRSQPIFSRAAYRVASHWGVSSLQEIDDIVQDTFLKLGSARQDALWRAHLENDAAATRYLSVMAANTARDHFRSRYAEKRGESHRVSDESVLDAIMATPDPGFEHGILLSQVDSVLEGGERERTVFWLYYKQGFTAREIAGIPAFGLSTKGVESVIHRLTAAAKRVFSMPSAKGKTPGEAS